MEAAPSSRPERPRKSAQKSRVANGSAVVPGVDQRGAWCRRCKENYDDLLSALPDAAPGEQWIAWSAAVEKTELEMLARGFALSGQSDPATFDLFIRGAGNMRRDLEAVGLKRRQVDVTPSLRDYLAANYGTKDDDDVAPAAE